MDVSYKTPPWPGPATGQSGVRRLRCENDWEPGGQSEDGDNLSSRRCELSWRWCCSWRHRRRRPRTSSRIRASRTRASILDALEPRAIRTFNTLTTGTHVSPAGRSPRTQSRRRAAVLVSRTPASGVRQELRTGVTDGSRASTSVAVEAGQRYRMNLRWLSRSQPPVSSFAVSVSLGTSQVTVETISGDRYRCPGRRQSKLVPLRGRASSVNHRYGFTGHREPPRRNHER